MTANSLESKALTLLQLLKIEPESLPKIVRCTGWGESQTLEALNLLLAQGKVRKIRRNRGGVTLFKVVRGVN